METQWTWFGQGSKTKGQLTQLKIIEGALKLFSEGGFHSVTLQQIAKETGTSHPLILKHFKSKENLLVAVRKFVSFNNHQWVDGKIKDDMDGRQRIFTFCYENFVWGNQNPAQAKIILLTYYYQSLDQKNGVPGDQAFKMGVARLQGHCMQAQREGLWRVDEDLSVVAELIHEYAVGLFVRMIATHSGDNKRLSPKYKKKLNLFLDRFLKF